MQLKIDHVTICGLQLEPLQPAFAGLGLAADYGGPHANGITHMALLGFEDGSYLELIAPYENQAQGSPWANLMLGDAGPGAWAVGTSDIHNEVARLQSLGIPTAGPIPGSRQRPDGKLLEWETASAGPGTMGSLLPFIIQDHTPREWRVQPSAGLQGSGLSGIAAVVLGVRSLEAATDLFRRAYGWEPPRVEDHPENGVRVAHFPGTPVMLAASLGHQEGGWLAERLEKFGEIPAAFLFGTSDIRPEAKRFHLIGETEWFDRPVAWFDAAKLHGVRLGVLQA